MTYTHLGLLLLSLFYKLPIFHSHPSIFCSPTFCPRLRVLSGLHVESGSPALIMLRNPIILILALTALSHLLLRGSCNTEAKNTLTFIKESWRKQNESKSRAGKKKNRKVENVGREEGQKRSSLIS